MKYSGEKIEAMIYTIRGQRVMLDSDLAKLYGVETKRLKEMVKRNMESFPDDFLLIPNSSELASLRSQIATLGHLNSENLVQKHIPFLFTENGVAMLSSVLKSQQAIQVHISIMRTFTKLRSFLVLDAPGNGLKEDTNRLFKVVFERLDNIEEVISTKLPTRKKKIGLRED